MIAFYLAEEVIIGLVEGTAVAESVPTFGSGSLGGLASVGLLMATSLLPFFAVREADRVLRPGTLRDLFLARHSKAVNFGSREHQ